LEEVNNIRMRLFTEEDIPFAMALKALVGWNQNEADLKRYITCEPTGCFIGELDGKAFGTVTTTTYEAGLAWIGLVLVDPEKRRKGLGTALAKYAVNYIRARGIETIKLDSTPMGKSIYKPIGFIDEYTIYRYHGKGGLSGAEDGVRSINEGDLLDIVDFDRPFFGVTRERVLRELRRDYPEYAIMIEDNHGIAGYAMARGGYDAFQIGPCMAKNSFIAEKLIRALLQRLPRELIIIDVPLPNKEGHHLAKKYSFEVHSTLDRMCLGENKLPGCPERTFSTACAGKG
jgi:GNAT superfamily N-acetyltransferase